MPDTDALKKYLDAGMAFTQLTRKRAEQVVKDLVAAGELQRNQAKGAIDELVERSRKNADLLSEQVRKEVDSQLSSMGLARKADVERLEAELAKLQGSGGDGEASAEKPAKKAKPSTGPPAKPSGEEPAKASGDALPVSKEMPAKAPAGQKAPAKPKTEEKAEERTEEKAAPPSKEAPAKKAAAKEAAEEKPSAPAKKAPAKKAPAKKAPTGPDTATPDMRMPAKKAAKVAKKQG